MNNELIDIMSAGFKNDCPKCHGVGAYFMTGSDYEEPIQCICDDYEGKEWEKLKAEWITDGW